MGQVVQVLNKMVTPLENSMSQIYQMFYFFTGRPDKAWNQIVGEIELLEAQAKLPQIVDAYFNGILILLGSTVALGLGYISGKIFTNVGLYSA